MPATATHVSHCYTCFGFLRRRDTDSNISISQGKHGRWYHVMISRALSRANFTNVHEPSGWVFKNSLFQS